MPYIANTDADRKAMLDAIGVSGFSELWRQAGVREPPPEFKTEYAGHSEFEVLRQLTEWAALNSAGRVWFAGGGFYDHFIPAAVSHIADRGEFLTSYTPYQPEASQGTLQAIYEYQSAMCRLMGMEVSNASMYDGGTALFEAIFMAVRQNRRRKIVLAGTLSPLYRDMIRTYSRNLDVLVHETSDRPEHVADELQAAIDEETTAVVVQYPDFLGTVTDWSPVTERARDRGAVSICSCYPASLSLLKPPGDMGFDIATGEGQSLGLPLSFGGPYLGIMTATSEFMRKMPGRICGRTVDNAGRPGFVLTLQAREQHIRREKATSNICTNESLCALRAVVHLSLLGRSGFKKMGELCASKAVYARNLLTAIPGVNGIGTGSFFNEFVIELPVPADQVYEKLLGRGIVAGIPLGGLLSGRERQILVAVTEKRSRTEIEDLTQALEAAL